MTTERKLPFHRVSFAPLIVVSVAGPDLEPTVAAVDDATDAPFAVLCLIWWAIEVDLALLCRQRRRIRARHPRATLVYLANTREELALLRSVKLDAELCNHNAFVDEDRFALPSPPARRYRAIYNAALAPYKRHGLARDVESLALVAYPNKATPEGYVAQVHAALNDATWLNFSPPDRFVWLDDAEVARHIGAADVGLCLSAEEGAMYASIEYLLCGLPIVTTPSLGGRHAFFDDEHSLVVEPEAAAIAAGVAAMRRRAPPPEAIRDRTLALVRQHRERYDALVEEVSGKLGATVPRVGRVRGDFVPRMFRWQTPSRVRELATGAQDPSR
jgi:hypothetical protein